MRHILICALILIVLPDLKAQKQDEKSLTQHILQVAANKVHLEYIKKGYRIVQEGLDIVSSFKRGEYKLHDAFFKSLKMVNPAVRRYDRVGQVIDLQKQIGREVNSLKKETGGFTKQEQQYIQRVLSRLLKQSEFILDELITLTTDHKLEMRDDERMARIDKLFTAMQDAYSFCKAFGHDIRLLGGLRLSEEKDVKISRELHGLKDAML